MSSSYNRKDHFYQKAKDLGYRSRAAFKLKELQDKYKIIKKGDNVLDLGCYPGGWLQIASQISGHSGKVIGIDLKDVDPFPKSKFENIQVIKGDLLNFDAILPEILSAVNEAENTNFKFDVVISDMSPALTGIKDKDIAGIVEVFSLAISYCRLLLKPNGNFLAKIFPGQEIEDIFKSNKKDWNSFQKTVLKSTRNSSNELYVIGKSYNKNK